VAKPGTVPKPDAQRWKLELTGTSVLTARELEDTIRAVKGWQHLQTRTEHGKGVTRLFIATDLNVAPEQIAQELGRRLPRVRPTLHRLNPPTTWAAIRERLARTADGRDSFTRARAVLPTA
jgi:hypothetical protein